ncbi:MAG: tetratricopeptide repeat protein, partial [Blastocatellia bacterium]
MRHSDPSVKRFAAFIKHSTLTVAVCSSLLLCINSVYCALTNDARAATRSAGERAAAQPQSKSISASTAEKLALGESVSRSISGGEQQSYEVNLSFDIASRPSASQYVRFTLEKGDLNLSAVVLGPEGNHVINVACTPRTLETLSILANSPGNYKITVQSNEKAGYCGRYVLKSDQPRRATARDSIALLAERSLHTADRLSMEWKAESFAKALIEYRNARSYWRRLRDVSGQALAALGEANVLFELSENKEAATAFRLALHLSDISRDVRLQIEALNGLSRVLIDLSEFSASLGYSTRARELSLKAGDRLGLAESLDNIGLQYYETGNMRDALPTLGEALTAFKETGSRQGQAEALAYLGYTHQDLGDSKQALDDFQNSLSLAADVGNRRIQALDLTAIGLVNSVFGEKQKALDFHNKALTILRRIGNRRGEAVVDDGIADVYSDMGEYRPALDYCTRALHIFDEIGDSDLEGLIMGLIGDIYLKADAPAQALTWYRKRLTLCRISGSEWVAAHTLNDIGNVYDRMHQTHRALAYYNRALAEERVRNDRRGQAYSLASIGFNEEELSGKDAALLHHRQAFDLFRRIADAGGQIQALHNIVRVERDLGRIPEAYRDAKSLIELLESQRSKLAGPEFRTAYLASVHEHYELYVDVLMRMRLQNPSAGYDAAAFEASETARARSLLDLLRE